MFSMTAGLNLYVCNQNINLMRQGRDLRSEHTRTEKYHTGVIDVHGMCNSGAIKISRQCCTGFSFNKCTTRRFNFILILLSASTAQNPEKFVELAADLPGTRGSEVTKPKKFEGPFGATLHGTSLISFNILNFSLQKGSTKHLLWALIFLKGFPMEPCHSGGQ